MANDGSDWIRPGIRVNVKDKGLEGTIRFFGTTEFAPGKWVGVELDEPKGKNNGNVKGKSYFECREQHGLFVRIGQIEPMSDIVPPTPSGIPFPKSIRKPGTGKKSPGSGSPALRRSQLPKSSKSAPEGDTTSTPLQVTQTVTKETTDNDDNDNDDVQKPTSFAPPVVGMSGNTSQEMIDLQQKVAILQHKRIEDKSKIKDLEKFRLQFQQMVEYKSKWTESQSELKQQLKQAKKEARDAQLQKEQIEEEMRELSDAVEIATLDKEMAEEKCEGLQSENEALKERIQELTIDLDILQNEISESGFEGAAASGQVKQLEHQNARLKEALVRLRDVSNEEKTEHQRVLKDLENQTIALTTLREQKDRIDEELKAADDLIATLKEQCDVAMGAEDMVEKLTDTNLQLEEEISQLRETVNDLEALRELSEQQEELRVEEEHELREDLDLNMNSIRQMERRLDASQETIVDQQQTIEKFRELVRQLQADLSELRKTPQEGDEVRETPPVIAPDVVLTQLKSSAVKAYSRTIDYELRKLEAQQAVDTINHLKSFMPNSFLVSGGDYEALSVMMLLPRLVFKAELIMDQLRQQTNLEDILGSLSTLKANPKTDLLTYICFLIYKLTTLQQHVNCAIRVLNECDVQMYRQMGALMDDLGLHERALDILIELLKKEQLDESVPLNGVEKAINHFEMLLQTRLAHECKNGQTELLQNQMKVIVAGSDYSSLELLRLKFFAPGNGSFITQLREMETFNNDIHQNCRKIRRRVPTNQSGKTVVCPLGLIPVLINQQKALVTNFRALYNRVHQKSQGLSEDDLLTNGELETFMQEVAKLVLQELMATMAAQPDDIIQVSLSKTHKELEKFLNDLQDGEYDARISKDKVVSPLSVRAQVVKGELSDTEGLKYKLEEKANEILEIKKALKLKGQEVTEINVKVGLLEKKLETADAECARKVEEEKMETERMKTIMEQQESKFNRAIQVLQGDMEALENEKDTLKQQLESHSRTAIPGDIAGTRRTMSMSGRKTLAALLSKSPIAPHRGHSIPSTLSTLTSSTNSEGKVEGVEPVSAPESPLLLAHIDSLRKALSFSQDENIQLKTEIAKTKMASLPPLRVPKRMTPARLTGSDDRENENNYTDVEKSLRKRTALLLQNLSSTIAQSGVIDITKKEQKDDKEKEASPREKLAQQMATILDLRQQAAKLKEDTQFHLAGTYPGGLVQTKVKPFVSSQFTKALVDFSSSKLIAKLHFPPQQSTDTSTCSQTANRQQLFLSANQFEALHSAVVN